MFKKRLLAAFGALAIVAAACGGTTTTPSAGTPAPGQTPGPTGDGTGQLAAEQVYRAYIADTDPETLTPYHAQDAVSNAVLASIHRGLLYYDKDLNSVPAAAEALPEITDGGKTLTYKIRADAVYADGDPIVAADFVRAFRQLIDPRLANPYSYIVCPVAGAAVALGADLGCGDGPTPTDDAAIEAALDNLGVEAPDEKTFVIRLDTAATYFTAITAMWLTVPIQEDWIGPDGTLTDEAIVGNGSGPFVIDRWDHGSDIVLKPNPNWYGEVKPTLQEVHLVIGGALEAAFTAYEQDELDAVQVTSTAIIHQIDDDPALKAEAHDSPQLALTYYDFANCQAGDAKCPAGQTKDGKSPTANKNFRIALTQAIDKQEFINVTFGGLGLVANSVVMPGIPGYDADYNPYPFDIAAANEHMTTALQELGATDKDGDGKVTPKDLGTMKFGYNCNAGHLPRVTYLAEHWRTALGFDETQFDIRCSDFPVFLKERPDGKYNISRDGWGADFPHAVNQLSDLFRCGGGNNNGQYCNPEFDALLDQAAVETDPDKATQLYIDAQRKMVDDAPSIFLRYGVTRWMAKSYVSDLVPTSSDRENIGDYFLETIKILEH
jgi:oligopeptide transport system substrate-binding protein